MAFLQALHTLNLTPHPAPVAPLADPEWPNEELQDWFYSSEMESVLSLGEA